MFEIDAPLVGRRQVGRDMWVLAFDSAPIAAAALPGQFVNIGLSPGPLLRRPFSVYGASERVEILLKPVGTGTEQLLSLQLGDRVSLLGPLGNGFAIEPGRRVLLVSGGLGAASMPLAAAKAKELGCRVTWAHGARTGADLCTEWQGDELIQATDDGSVGFRGSVLDALTTGAGDSPQVLACGPNPMLRALAARHPQAQVALETYMGCGTGVCLGCAVPLAAGGYDRACKEGPVYRAADIDWEALPGHLHYSITSESSSPRAAAGG